MGFIEYVQGAVAKWSAPGAIRQYQREAQVADDKAEYFKEALSTLQIEIENQGYMRLTQLAAGSRFDRNRLMGIIDVSINMAIKNPITKRSVKVMADYTFGRGVRFVAKDPNVQQVIDENVDYPGNRAVLTSHLGMTSRSNDLLVTGNLYIACFTNERTGRVVWKNIDVHELVDVITDPNDYDRVLFFKRSFFDGQKTVIVYHPAVGITPNNAGDKAPWDIDKSKTNEQGPIEWDAPVYRIAPNRYGKEQFAVPEVYAQNDWNMAYNRFLGDWTSIIRSFAKMALKITGLTGKRQQAAIKGMIGSTVTPGNPLEKNPSNIAGSIGLFKEGMDVSAVKTAGATTPASDGAPVLNMAACAMGLPGSFYGDVTKDGLDRSAELLMESYQNVWRDAISDLFNYAILQSSIAPEGILRKSGWSATEDLDPFENRMCWSYQPPTDVDPGFVCHFPEVKEHNVTDRVRALSNAVTFFGKVPTDIIPDKEYVARLILEALDVQDDIEDLLPIFRKMWAKNAASKDGKSVDPGIIPPPPPQVKGGAEDPSQGGDVGNNG